MELPVYNLPEKISIFMQLGLVRDIVKVETSELSLEKLTEIACDFTDKKFPYHGLSGLPDRLSLFLHDYGSKNLLRPIKDVSDLTDGALIEIIVSVEIEPHNLSVHSYKSPAFCDYCGGMLMGLFRQGLKCDSCGGNFHKRCAYKMPNKCSHKSKEVNGVEKEYKNFLEPIDSSMSGTSSVTSGRRASIRVPHTYVVHSYTKPTICQHCKKLLIGVFRQGMRCVDCKFNIHKKCMRKSQTECRGEAPKYWSEMSVNSQEEDESKIGSFEENFFDNSNSATSLEFDNEPDEYEDELPPVYEEKYNNIKIMRLYQSVQHVEQRGSKVLKEGWLSHYTDMDKYRRNHYWRLKTKGLTLFQNEESFDYYIQIPLTDILHVNLRTQNPNQGLPYCFELKTTNITYYVGEDFETCKAWETAIRQALMPVIPKAIEEKMISGSLQDSLNVCLQFQILSEEILGSGQFGIVYGGIHRTTRRNVAIKVIDKLRFPSVKEAQLKNEVSILQNIEHPGVVRLEKMFESPERIFIVMEKLKGDMLDMIIRSPNGRLSERSTKFLITQILVALRYLHSQNICHCDLKPENVLLSTDSEFPLVKLCDFGYAKIIGEKSFRRSVVGTPAYLAPEVLRKKGYNKSLDMWSVGVIIYVSLSGTFPYNEGEDISDQITNAAFMYPKDPWDLISKDAVELINGLLKVDSRIRFSVDKSLNHTWLQDYEVWCDLKELEAQVGSRWVTHESDDERWEKFQKD
jgi:protein kinase D